jgi:hypothetical protein
VASAIGFFLVKEPLFISLAVVLCGTTFFLVWRVRSADYKPESETLIAGTGLLTVAAMCFYVDAILPRMSETLRNRAALVAKIVPSSEPIYAVDPGPQPVFFYLRKPWFYVADWDQLPKTAKYVLASERDEPTIAQRFGQGARSLFRYRDRGEKQFSLYFLGSK